MKKKILFVENSPEEYARFKKLAESNGYEPCQATDYETAMACLSASQFYAVLVEIDAIGKISCIDTLVRTAKPQAMVMLKGSECHEDIICQAICLGADDFMRTPFSDSILVARSRSVIKRITERRNTHARSLNTLIDLVPVMMLVSDGSGNVVSVNKIAESQLGISRQECQERKVCQILGCEMAASQQGCLPECSFCKIQHKEAETMASGKNAYIRQQKILQRVDGRALPKSFNLSMAPLELDGRKMVIIVIEDVTSESNSVETLAAIIGKLQKSVSDSQDQVKISSDASAYLRQMNNNLQSEKKKLQMLFDNMSSGFLLFRTQGDAIILEEANAKASEILGVDIAGCLGLPLPEIEVPAIQDSRFTAKMQGVMGTGKSACFKLIAPEYPVKFKISMYVPGPGYVAVLMSDITDEVKSHESNLALSKQLKNLNLLLDDRKEELLREVETKKKFISILAHDLRNPFNAIIGLSDMLGKRLETAGDTRSLGMARVIQESAQGAYDLLVNVLKWAKSQQDAIHYQPAMLSLRQVAAEAISEIMAQAERKRIMLLNQADDDCMIWADRQMLLTIIRNITSNAIKFTKEGGLVVIASQQLPGSTTIIIEDNGVGMAPDVIEKLFEVSQNKSTQGTLGERGSGMGLLITKEFVDRHSGQIKVESTVGLGSKFMISIPMAQKSET